MTAAVCARVRILDFKQLWIILNCNKYLILGIITLDLWPDLIHVSNCHLSFRLYLFSFSVCTEERIFIYQYRKQFQWTKKNAIFPLLQSTITFNHCCFYFFKKKAYSVLIFLIILWEFQCNFFRHIHPSHDFSQVSLHPSPYPTNCPLIHTLVWGTARRWWACRGLYH